VTAELLDRDRLDVLVEEAVEDAGEGIDRDGLPVFEAQYVGEGVLQVRKILLGAVLAEAVFHVAREQFPELDIVGEVVEAGAEPEVSPVRRGIDEEHADGALTPARQASLQDRVDALTAGDDRNNAGRHMFEIQS
jgi:hypothetical protein